MQSIERVRSRVLDVLPHGTPLPEADWARRHSTISDLALLHVPVVLGYALLMDFGLLHAILETRSVQVECADGLRLHLNPDAAQQVLTNLLGNALKFATPGTPISVHARPSARGGTRIEVANRGPEVPPEQRERIFEPFVQGDQSSTRTADGVGLGLHIVHRVVTAIGGDIAISCEDGITTFTVWIPAPLARIESVTHGAATATVA